MNTKIIEFNNKYEIEIKKLYIENSLSLNLNPFRLILTSFQKNNKIIFLSI